MSLENIERLARLHPDAKDPYDPYKRVGLLFNADFQVGMDRDVDRADWEVLSPFEIRYSKNTEASVIDRVVDKIFELADTFTSRVYREDEESVSWGKGDSCVRLLSLKDVGVGLLQRIDEQEGIVSTRIYLFDATGITGTFFTSVPIEELGDRDWVGEAIKSDITGGATSEADEDDFFKTLLYPLKSDDLDE